MACLHELPDLSVALLKYTEDEDSLISLYDEQEMLTSELIRRKTIE